MRQILQSYLRKLTNLTSNNRSLFLPRISSKDFIDIHEFEYLLNEPSFGIIEQLIAKSQNKSENPQAIPVCDVIDSRDAGSNTISERLYKLQRKERFIYEEQGSEDLNVGWPFVKGKFNDGTLVRCPLLFFPVTLERRDNRWYIRLRKEVNITLNKSFLLAYSYFNKVPITDNFLENVIDDYDTDSRIFRTSLYELLKNSPVSLNFNQEIFIDQLNSFKNYKKTDIDSSEQPGVLKLFPEAVMGIFPQAGSYIVPDYLTLLENEKVKDVNEFFAQKTRTEDVQGLDILQKGQSKNQDPSFLFSGAYFLNKVKEEQTFAPYQMDTFQENALKAVKKGNSMVVQGPPGTGKSQLIVNLISDFIARGKTVLVVCQKRAALDVVYQRLADKKVEAFAGLVHDFKNNRKDIFNKISSEVDALYEYRMHNNSLDTIYLERNFLQLSRRIEQITEELDEFKFALFDEREAGISIKELYLTSDIDAPYLDVKQEYNYFKIPELPPFVRKLRAYTAYSMKFDAGNYPWRERKSFKDYSLEDLKKLSGIISGIPEFKSNITHRAGELLGKSIDYTTCEEMEGNRKKIEYMLADLDIPDVFEYFQHILKYPDSQTDMAWFTQIEKVVMGCFRGQGPEVSLSFDKLGNFQGILQRAISARKSPFTWLKWHLLSKDKQKVKKVAEANAIKFNKKGLNVLAQRIDNRLNLEHYITQMKNCKWLINLPSVYDKAIFQNWFYNQKKALQAKMTINKLPNYRDYFEIKNQTLDHIRSQLHRFWKITGEISKEKAFWRQYLTEKQINRLIEEVDYAEALLETLKSDFDALCEFDQLHNNFRSFEIKLINKIYDFLDEIDEDKVENLFQNSIRLAWIDHIETKYPVLRTVSSQKLRRLEQELQEAIHEKTKISNEILLLKVREKTYKNVEYNRLQNMVTYRDLYHQVNKKRKIWPLRKLVDNFWEEMADLVPCWLASPESVSAIFPLEEQIKQNYPMFDLVVFDEASQCFAEKGIPAMYRGRQVVVSGDDKQLSPNDLYQVRWEDQQETEENADAPALEVDSLLDLASNYLMEVQLKGHYRSKTLDLIDFSNYHFYDSSLTLLPDFEDANRNEPAIKYIKVEGTWEKNINEEECQKVIEIVKELQSQTPQKSIGVITFNIKQQNRILDYFDEEYIKAGYPMPTGLIVKNIENVQGDEKDIIIFSTAYAPDKQGKIQMRFGSLNAEKGENRLNVAVTRAREKIYLVTSIYPDELKVGNTKNEGPKLLQEYLRYAYNVSEGHYKPSLPVQGDHNIDWFLNKKLMNWINDSHQDVEALRELPFTDLTIKGKNNSQNGEGYIGIINTDDDLYYQSLSAKDNHAYKPYLLNQKRWRHKMVYSREFWQNKEELKGVISKFIQQQAKSE